MLGCPGNLKGASENFKACDRAEPWWVRRNAPPGTLHPVNHPVAPPPKRRVVHPTAAEIRRAMKAATRPDGTVDAFAVGFAIAQPFGIREAMAREAAAALQPKRAPR